MAVTNSNDRLMDNLKVDLNISPELKHLIAQNKDLAPNAIKLGLRSITKEGSKQIKNRIKSLGLVEHDRLWKSIKGVSTNRKSFIGTKLFYAPFLEDGVKAHKIAASKHKSLFFGHLFTKKVKHPGIRAYHFFENTWNQMERSGQVQSLFADGVQKAIEAVQNGSRS